MEEMQIWVIADSIKSIKEDREIITDSLFYIATLKVPQSQPGYCPWLKGIKPKKGALQN